MGLFIDAGEETCGIIAEGVRYLRIEGTFYCGIGCLFLLYGLYRAMGRPGMSVVLTVISLGTRVALAYAALRHPGAGGGGHLVVGAHRLVSGRRGGAFLLPLPQKAALRPAKAV